MTAIRVLFVVPQGPQSPGPRYRVFQFLPYYEEAGLRTRVVIAQGTSSTGRSLHSVHLKSLARALHYMGVWSKIQLTFLKVIASLGNIDVLYLYRIPVPGWAARFVRGAERVVFDLDDAIDESQAEPGLLALLRGRALRRGMRTAIAVSTRVIASNRRNAGAIQAMGGQAVVIPTCIDVPRYPYRDRRTIVEDRPVVGWIGTPSTSEYLEAIEEALLRVAERHEFRVRLVGAARSPFLTMPVELRPWRLETEVDEISAFDIGIMPMPDTPWTSGKAALKALQYGASGAPTVASRTETNIEILGEREGTLFCSTTEEWRQALEHLLEEAGIRSEVGRRGRARVAQMFSVESQLRGLLDVIRPDAADVAAGEPSLLH